MYFHESENYISLFLQTVFSSKTTGAEQPAGRGGVCAAMPELGLCLGLVWPLTLVQLLTLSARTEAIKQPPQTIWRKWWRNYSMGKMQRGGVQVMLALLFEETLFTGFQICWHKKFVFQVVLQWISLSPHLNVHKVAHLVCIVYSVMALGGGPPFESEWYAEVKHGGLAIDMWPSEVTSKVQATTFLKGTLCHVELIGCKEREMDRTN